MDPLTHFTSGAILSKSMGFKSNTKTIIFFGGLALVPDIDNFISFFGNKADYLLYHRGVTHSLWGGIFLGILAAFVLKHIYQKRYLFSALISVLIIYTHIYLDYVTSYGTQLLAPFNRHRFALSSVFIIDPFYTCVLLLLLIFALIKSSRKTAIIAAIFLVFYPLANFGIKSLVQIKTAKLTSDKVITTTTTFSPLYWKVIIEDKNTYRVKDVNTFENINLSEFSSFTKFDKENTAYKFDTKFLKTFLWFVDYPVITGKNGEYEIFDLKFMLNSKLFDKNERKAFALKLKTNNQGEIIDYTFN